MVDFLIISTRTTKTGVDVIPKFRTYPKSKDLMIRSSSAEFLIFERQTHDKGVQVRFEDGDLWLTQKAIGELFDIDRSVVTKHIKNIYLEFI